MTKENLFLCMGSACHQLGVYEVLPKLQALIKEYNLEDAIELKGSFCLEQCRDGITMKLKDLMVIDVNPQNVEDKFIQEIVPVTKS